MIRKLLLVSFLALATAACSVALESAGEIDEGADSLMKGQGLFSGKDGELTLYGPGSGE